MLNSVAGAADLSDKLRNPFVTNAPTRSLNTPFQVSTTRPALVGYSVRITNTSTLLGTQFGAIQLRSDASNPPTTIRQQASQQISGVVATVGAGAQLTYLVPAGHFVSIVTATISGTPTYNLDLSVEQIL